MRLVHTVNYYACGSQPQQYSFSNTTCIDRGERSVKNEMYKMIIVCPQCGQKLCRAELGSKIEICCPKCKAMYDSQVENNGGVHPMPMNIKAVSKTEYKKVN